MLVATTLAAAIAARRRWEVGALWLLIANLSLVLSVSSLLLRPMFGFEATAALVVFFTFGALAANYDAVLVAQGRPSRWRVLLPLAGLDAALHFVLAIVYEHEAALMFSSSVVNSCALLVMILSLRRGFANAPPGVELLMTAPFVAVFLGYFGRLGVMIFLPGVEMKSAMTVMIVTVLAWTSIILQIGLIALSEGLARRRAADALRRAEEAAKAKALFLRRVSHELRTPLNGVLGCVEIVRAETLGPIPDAYRQVVDEIKACGMAQLQLVEDLLHISEIETGALSLDCVRVELGVVARASLARRGADAHEAGKILSFERGDGAELTVEGDATRIAEMIDALLDNAVAYARSEVRVSAWRRDGLVLIAVEDDGPGIAPDEVEAALQLFVRLRGANDPRAGRGVGLALAKAIALGHGGALTIETGEKGGARVVVELPFQCCGAPVRAPRPSEARAATPIASPSLA